MFMLDKSIKSTLGKSARSIDFTGRSRSELGGERVMIASADVGWNKF